MSGVGWCRVAGLAETITNSVKLKVELRLSLAKINLELSGISQIGYLEDL